MFLKSILNICWIYIVLFVLFLCLYGIYSINAFVFYVILTLILLIGIILDKRFILSRKIIFIILLLLQFVIFMYLEIIPLVLLKDIFWFSVVLNIGFVWHYLILIWLYDYAVKKEKNYWCFLISRISLLTSLSFFNIIISSILLINDNLNLYINKFKFIYNWLELLSLILYRINIYFIKIFNLYSLFLLGIRNIKYKLNMELLKNIGILIIFLLLSLLLGIPRIYLIWLFYGINNLFWKLKSIIYVYIKYKHILANFNFIIMLSSEYDNEILRDSIHEILFSNRHDISFDFSIFLNSPKWKPFSGFDYFSIYDILNLFIYDDDLRIKIYVNFFMYFNNLSYEINDINNSEDILHFINVNRLNCTIDKFLDIYQELIYQGYFNIINIQKDSNWSIVKYILKFNKGRYIISYN